MQQLARTRRPAAKRAREAVRARAVAAGEQRREQSRRTQQQRAEQRRAARESRVGANENEADDEAAGRRRAAALMAIDSATELEAQERSERRGRVLALLVVVALVTVGVTAWAGLRSPRSTSALVPVPVPEASNVPSAAPGRGTYLRAEIEPDGMLRTELSLAAGGEPIRELVLSLPSQSVGTSDLTATLSGLQVRADGLLVSGAPQSLTSGEIRSVQLPEPARVVQVVFVTAGVVDRATESVPGRALVLLNPLQVDAGTDAPGAYENVVTVAEEGVLGLACVMSGAVPLQPCGQDGGDSWTVTWSGETTTPVVAQVDLPQA